MTGTRTASALLVVSLAAHAGAAHALDIDRIGIHSRLGEPLRAQIPVTGTTEELRALQAQLAAPVTFARIGLPRPQGVVADLRFAVVRAPDGGAVIRVSSALPVEQEFFTFLIQLDWGSGRMVREYSVALEDGSLPASPPPLQSAVAARPDRVVRAPDAAAIGSPAEQTAPIPLAEGAAASPPAVAVAPIPLASPASTRKADVAPRAPEPEQAPEAVAAPAPAARKASTRVAEPPAVAHDAPAPATSAPAGIPTASELAPINSGDTLTAIASRLDRGGHTLNQMMLALLRANPDAFARGNINLLRRGAVLRVPPATALSRHDAAQAAAVVAEQIRQWRDGEMPAMHPAALPDEAPTQLARTAPAEAPRVAPPRLEIAAPAMEAVATASAAVQSGIAVADGGHELRTEAPTEAATQIAPVVQLEQMQARIAELETLQRDQQALIALQNSALAARRSDGLPWAGLAAALAVVFALGWGLARRWNGSRSTQAAPVAGEGVDPPQVRPTWHGDRKVEAEPA